jgi:hypothetical protein
LKEVTNQTPEAKIITQRTSAQKTLTSPPSSQSLDLSKNPKISNYQTTDGGSSKCSSSNEEMYIKKLEDRIKKQEA